MNMEENVELPWMGKGAYMKGSQCVLDYSQKDNMLTITVNLELTTEEKVREALNIISNKQVVYHNIFGSIEFSSIFVKHLKQQ